MSWNYRIVRYLDGRGFGLHEVFYDENGLPYGMTESPCAFVCGPDERPRGVVASLEDALLGLSGRVPLDEPEVWPGRNPADEEATDGQPTETEG